MGAPMHYRDFVRIFGFHGVTIEEVKKSSHLKMKKVIDGVTVIYIAVHHKNAVEDVYVQKARKAFRLTPKDGVPDKEFFSR
jgi:hypothetical protein